MLTPDPDCTLAETDWHPIRTRTLNMELAGDPGIPDTKNLIRRCSWNGWVGQKTCASCPVPALACVLKALRELFSDREFYELIEFIEGWEREDIAHMGPGQQKTHTDLAEVKAALAVAEKVVP